MRCFFKILILGCIILCCTNIVLARTSQGVVANSFIDKDITERMPSIAKLQSLAVENSPLLKMNDADLLISKLIIKSKKRVWMSSLGIDAGAKYGLFDNLIISEDLGLVESNTSTTEQTRYNVGLYLKMPISSFIDRSSVDMAQAELNKVKYQRESTIAELKKLIIVLYGNVIKADAKLKIYITAIESLKAQVIEAELKYKNGQIDLVDYTSIKSEFLNAQLAQEEAKVEFMTSFEVLQETVGTEFKLN